MRTYKTKSLRYHSLALFISLATLIAGAVTTALVHIACVSMIVVGGLSAILFACLVANEHNKCITLKDDVVIIPKESRRNGFEMTKRYAVAYSKMQSIETDTTRSTVHSLKCGNRYTITMKDGVEIGFKVEGVSSIKEEIIIEVIKNRIGK